MRLPLTHTSTQGSASTVRKPTSPAPEATRVGVGAAGGGGGGPATRGERIRHHTRPTARTASVSSTRPRRLGRRKASSRDGLPASDGSTATFGTDAIGLLGAVRGSESGSAGGGD